MMNDPIKGSMAASFDELNNKIDALKQAIKGVFSRHKMIIAGMVTNLGIGIFNVAIGNPIISIINFACAGGLVAVIYCMGKEEKKRIEEEKERKKNQQQAQQMMQAVHDMHKAAKFEMELRESCYYHVEAYFMDKHGNKLDKDQDLLLNSTLSEYKLMMLQWAVDDAKTTIGMSMQHRGPTPVYI